MDVIITTTAFLFNQGLYSDRGGDASVLEVMVQM